MILVEKNLVLNIRVVPNSSEFSVVSFDKENNLLKIRTKAKAQKGKANKELSDKLSELLGSKTEIVSGQKSRHKKLKVLENEKTKNFLKNLSNKN